MKKPNRLYRIYSYVSFSGSFNTFFYNASFYAWCQPNLILFWSCHLHFILPTACFISLCPSNCVTCPLQGLHSRIFPHFFLAYFPPLLSIYTVIVSSYPLFLSYSLLSLLFPPPSIIICLVRNSLSFSLGFFVTRWSWISIRKSLSLTPGEFTAPKSLEFSSHSAQYFSLLTTNTF